MLELAETVEPIINSKFIFMDQSLWIDFLVKLRHWQRSKIACKIIDGETLGEIYDLMRETRVDNEFESRHSLITLYEWICHRLNPEEVPCPY